VRQLVLHTPLQVRENEQLALFRATSGAYPDTPEHARLLLGLERYAPKEGSLPESLLRLRPDLLTLDPTRFGWVPRLRKHAYYTKCACTAEQFLAEKEIAKRVELGLGCGSVSCPSPLLVSRVWYTFEAAIRLQVAQASSMYSGYAATLPPSATVSSQAEAWVLSWFDILQVEAGAWWIKQGGVLDPRTSFGTRPSRTALFPQGHLMACLQGRLRPLGEWAEDLGIAPERLLWMKLQLWDWQIDQLLVDRGGRL